VKDLKDANAVIRTAKRIGSQEKIRFTDMIDIENCVVLGVGDAAFDNVENSGSQGGKLLLSAHKDILTSKELVPISVMEWTSNKVKRVVRSTLAAEAYVMGESAEGVEYLRALLAELFDPEYSVKNRAPCEERIAGILVTDARSLHDSLRKEGGAVRDRRLRLELNLIKCIPNLAVKWVKSEQMIADELTKEVSEEIHEYSRQVRMSGLWTLGDDPRCPPSRKGRKLEDPDLKKEEEQDLERESVLLVNESYTSFTEFPCGKLEEFGAAKKYYFDVAQTASRRAGKRATRRATSG